MDVKNELLTDEIVYKYSAAARFLHLYLFSQIQIHQIVF